MLLVDLFYRSSLKTDHVNLSAITENSVRLAEVTSQLSKWFSCRYDVGYCTNRAICSVL